MKILTLGLGIKNKRKELNITTEELAKRSGVDRTYISKIENHNLLPSARVMHKLSVALGGMDKLQEIYYEEKLRKPLKIPARIKSSKTDNELDKMRGLLHDHIINDAGAHHKPFITYLLKEFGPDKIKDKDLIEKMTSCMDKWRKEHKIFWASYFNETDRFINLIRKK